MKSGTSFITGLLAGVAIGGVLALLYAPQSGKETREKIKQKFSDLEKELEALKAKAGEKSDEVKSDLEERFSKLKKEMEDLEAEV
jgi:gas vesicle protein